MIEPGIGRVLWYRPSGRGGPKQAALVAKVIDNHTVNLAAFDELGRSYGVVGAHLVQPEDVDIPQGAYAEWMPFQKGQAMRTEQLERQVAGQPGSSAIGSGG